jgi:glycerol-1-phosphate dehydrogenase [NAD(P)+]
MDWLLSKVINSEYVCDFTWKIMVDDIKQITKNIDLAIERDGKTLNILMRLLSNSGIAMSMAGNSRPASGAEHIVSHFIEMYYELNNELPLFHGIQVSLGTLISLKAYNYLFNGLDSLKVIDIDIDERKKNLTKLFGESLGNQLMEIYNMKMKKLKKPDKALIEKAKNEILPVYSEFVESAEKAISKLNLESEYSKIDEDLIRKAVMFSNSLRDRYTIFDLFDSLGLIKDFSSKCL